MFSKRVVYKDIEPWPGYYFDVEAIVHWDKQRSLFTTIRHVRGGGESHSMRDLQKLPVLTEALRVAVEQRFKVKNVW